LISAPPRVPFLDRFASLVAEHVIEAQREKDCSVTPSIRRLHLEFERKVYIY
jgi:hypothetical protein